MRQRPHQICAASVPQLAHKSLSSAGFPGVRERSHYRPRKIFAHCPLLPVPARTATSVGESYFGGGDPKTPASSANDADPIASAVVPEDEDPKFVDTNAGVRMPRFLYGTAWKEERTTELVIEAVRQGFVGIDTACQPKHYREDLVGDACVRLGEEGLQRENIFVQTKFTPVSGHDPQKIPYDASAPIADQVLQSFQTSLENLKTSYVDSLVLHSPYQVHDETMEAWRALERIVTKGGARQLGISNCYDLATLQALYKDARVKPAILQNRYHRDSGFDIALRQWCASKGIRYQSFWTLTANRGLLQSAAVQGIARARGRTPEQILFRFVLDEGICPLTGTSSPEHMGHDLQAMSDPPLSDAEGSAIFDAMFASETPRRNSGWCPVQ